MRNRNYIGIFERFVPPTDNFGAAVGEWQEVAREWVELKPQQLDPKGEIQDDNQTKSFARFIAECVWSPSLESAIDTSCRMKISKRNVVNESEPNSDENFRIFQIVDMVNVREMNRDLQLMVTERT